MPPEGPDLQEMLGSAQEYFLIYSEAKERHRCKNLIILLLSAAEELAKYFAFRLLSTYLDAFLEDYINKMRGELRLNERIETLKAEAKELAALKDDLERSHELKYTVFLLMSYFGSELKKGLSLEGVYKELKGVESDVLERSKELAKAREAYLTDISRTYADESELKALCEELEKEYERAKLAISVLERLDADVVKALVTQIKHFKKLLRSVL